MAEKIDTTTADNQQHNRMEMLKAFDETKAGVKGLIDAGMPKLPPIFVRPPDDELTQESSCENTQIQVPEIDLSDIQNAGRRKQILEQVKVASETWGFFQVVNHGIPQTVLNDMIYGIRDFNDMNIDEKKKYYSRDSKRSVRYNSSYDLFTSRTATWKDTLTIGFNSGHDSVDREELPPTCRESAIEYSKHVEILGNTLLELLSEALGLKTDHLKNIECCHGHRLHCHYYPPCPEPELAIGITKHSDAGFLTILLQNQSVSGLQVLYEGRWVDIQPVEGGLVVNIGDLLQLVSNGKFKSIEHRAKANRIGPRISIACFFSGPVDKEKIYGPITELISEENPPVYRDITMSEYVLKFITTSMEDYAGLDYYKL